MFDREITALSLEGDSLTLLAVRGKALRTWESASLSPGTVRDGLIVDPVEVGQAIRDLFARTGASRERVVVSLTGFRSVPRFRLMPRIEPNLLEAVMEREAKREMPVALEALYLYWRILWVKGEQQRVFLLGVPRDVVDAQVQALRQGGIEPYALDLKPLAVVRAVHRPTTIIGHLESDSLDVMVVVDCVPEVMRTIILGREISRPQDKVERLLDELGRTVKFYNDNNKDRPLSPGVPVCLTGRLITLPVPASLRNRIETRIGHRVEMPEPPLAIPPGFPLSRYMANIGLALKA